jgi:hypothetical protein
LKSYEPDAKAVNGFRKMRLVDGVQIAIGETVDHVSKRKEQEEDEDAFPELKRFQWRCVAEQDQQRNGEDWYLCDPKFNAPDAEHVNEITQHQWSVVSGQWLMPLAVSGS